MNDAVEGGREALNHWYGYPWYDPSTDGVRRVDVPKPWDLDWLPSSDFWSFPSSFLQWAAWVAILLLLAAVGYLLVRAFRRIEAREIGESEELAGGADRVDSLPVPLSVGPGDFLAEARRCRQRGDYARAIVFLFSHQLLQLDKHQRIRLARGKTNRQYMREVGPWPALRGLIEPTMIAFEEVFFGHRMIDAPAFETCWSRLDEFEKQVAS
jgi:hypothetical protein